MKPCRIPAILLTLIDVEGTFEVQVFKDNWVQTYVNGIFLEDRHFVSLAVPEIH
jgi:hypothetical protein